LTSSFIVTAKGESSSVASLGKKAMPFWPTFMEGSAPTMWHRGLSPGRHSGRDFIGPWPLLMHIVTSQDFLKNKTIMHTFIYCFLKQNLVLKIPNKKLLFLKVSKWLM
jgi:hypothetical protein